MKEYSKSKCTRTTVKGILPSTTNLINNFKTTLSKMLFPTIQLHIKKEKKKVLSFQNHTPLMHQRPPPLPSLLFSTNSAKLAISKNHEECQTTLIKSTILDLYQASTHHTTSDLINLQHKENSHIHKTRNNSINQCICCHFLHSVACSAHH